MKNVAKIIVAILLTLLAWKVVKGIFSILFVVAAMGLLVWGGMKLLGNDTRRIR